MSATKRRGPPNTFPAQLQKLRSKDLSAVEQECKDSETSEGKKVRILI